MSRFAAAVALSLQICELGPPSVQNPKRVRNCFWFLELEADNSNI